MTCQQTLCVQAARVAGGDLFAVGTSVRLAVWLSSATLLFATTVPPTPGGNASGECLTTISIAWNSTEQGHSANVVDIHAQWTSHLVRALAAGPPGVAFAATATGVVLQLSLQDGTNGVTGLAAGSEHMRLPEACDLLLADVRHPLLLCFHTCQCIPMAATEHRRVQESTGNAAECALFGLSAAGNLYRRSELVAQHVTSACLRQATSTAPAYLLYTTRSHTLHARPLRAPGGEVGGAERAVEPGALLVACPPGGARVVLQMPRGNLEGVQLRQLMLEQIAVLVDAGQFGQAFREAAAARVDPNFLVDLLGPAFLAKAPNIVDDIADVSDLCDLLAALQPGSCLAPGGKYAAFAALHSLEAAANFDDKVRRCSAALRQACEARPASLLPAVIMAHLRYASFCPVHAALPLCSCQDTPAKQGLQGGTARCCGCCGGGAAYQSSRG